MRRGQLFALLVALVAPFGRPASSSASEIVTGAFALDHGATAVSAQLEVTRVRPLEADIALVEMHAGVPIRDYDLEMTKRLHLIVISSDFGSFQHVHPSLGTDGRFTFDLHVPKAGVYYVYADALPHGFGDQVFRFAVPFGATGAVLPRSVGPLTTRVTVGPYTVAFDSLQLRAGQTSLLNVRVFKGSALANDLHPYLGAAAHVVLINITTLSYLHVHPQAKNNMGSMSGMAGMSMPGMRDDSHSPATMELEIRVARSGRYALWFEFRGGSNLYVAPFALRAT